MKKTSDIKIQFHNGVLYEIEIFVAKKSTNLSQLYEQLYTLLHNPNSTINGYSLYEVEGYGREKIALSKGIRKDFKTLKALQEKHGKGAFKDLIRPIVTTGQDQMAIFDEAAVVLKIIVEPRKPIDWDDSNNSLIQEIKEIFREITKTEKNIFFTVKELKKAGTIYRD